MDLTVKTRYGIVEGTQMKGICRWFGVPFAKPPIGDLRFKRAIECEPWSGILKTDSFGPSPFQFMVNKGTAKILSGEDCLYANIWAPRNAENAPVFVYFYGGANVAGDASDPMYEGTSFAENGIVYVTYNYRLGPLGFYDFSSFDDSFDSNCGVSDQIMGLRWIKENIKAFGGNPDNITICGESAGGTAVYNMLAAPSARGLFHRAIAMSGLADDTVSPRQNRLNMELFLEKMGMGSSEVPALKTMMPSEMLTAADWVYRMNNSVYPGIFVPGPVIDDLLPHRPWEAMANGSADGVDCIFGTCRDEGTLFYMMKMFPTSWDMVEKMLELNNIASRLPEFKRIYSGLSEKKAMQAVFRDRAFWAHSVMCSDAQSTHGRVYCYRNDAVYPLLRLAGLGAMHGSDIGTALNTEKGAMNFISKGTSKKRKKALRSFTHGSWINFAKTGDPNGTIPIRWETYDTNKKATMILNDICRIENNPHAEAYVLWKTIELYS